MMGVVDQRDVTLGVGDLRALLHCPLCRTELEWTPDSAVCIGCATRFQVEDGIPVLVAPDRHVDDDEMTHDHGAHNRRQASWFDDGRMAAFEIARPHGTPGLYQWLLRSKADRALGPIEDGLDGRIALVVCGGSGMDAEFISEHGARVITSDISLGAAHRAAERGRRFGIPLLSIVAAAEQLPFRDGSVDLVYVHDGLHHLADPLPALGEIARVSGRWIAITEPARAMATRFAVRLGLALDRESAGNRVIRFDPIEISTRLKGAGFARLRAERYAMYYRHVPGRVVRLLSRPRILPLAITGCRLIDAVLGRFGNKLVVVSEATSGSSGRRTVD